MKVACDNCGRKVARRRLYSMGRFQGREQLVCDRCLGRIAGGVAAVDRALSRERRRAT